MCIIVREFSKVKRTKFSFYLIPRPRYCVWACDIINVPNKYGTTQFISNGFVSFSFRKQTGPTYIFKISATTATPRPNAKIRLMVKAT